MKRVVVGVAVLALAVAVSLAWNGRGAEKLPKCSGQLCRSVGCSPDVLCAKGSTVVSCAEVCGGH